MTVPGYIIGVDTGGTFTDVAVLAETGELVLDKAPTTPDDFSRGVLDALEGAARGLGLDLRGLLGRCRLFKHGTTVGTNALITRTGARVGFITTRGFEDTTLIMRAVGRVDGLQEDEIKHMAHVTKPAPLVPRGLIKGVRERVDFQGNVIVPLNVEDARAALRSLVGEQKVDAVAVSLLFGWVNPVHELQIKRLAEELYPGTAFFTFAHELVPVVREYARANTVILNAFLGQTMDRYLRRLDDGLRAKGYGGPLLVMQANGGAVNREEMTPIGTLSSGPAGGVMASKFMADLLGHSHVITTDMGGTSFDVSLITDGFWTYAREPVVSRFRVTQPMIDVESIGAGGGTIARVERETGRLLVGPQSAGAVPGPVCYDAGGTEPTVTDADLVLGVLNPEYFLGGRRRLNQARAEAALRAKIGEPLGLDAVEAAAGISRIVAGQMADLIRKQVVRSGHVPEEYVLYAFGGAGPVHCTAYAAELGIREAYVFPSSAVFSAFGIAASDVIHTSVSSSRHFMPVDPHVLNKRLEGIEEGLYDRMRREGFGRDQVAFRRSFHMRFRRQMNELGVVVPVKVYDEQGIQEVMALFERKYEEVYGEGSAYSQAGIELISIHVDAVGRTPKPDLRPEPPGPSDPGGARKGTRSAYFPGVTGSFVDTALYDYERLHAGHVVAGPAIVETPITTVVIPPGRRARVDQYRNLCLEVG